MIWVKKVKRTYISKLFQIVSLFSNEDAARNLFNAVEDMHYGPDTPVKITTLENVFYLGKNNDLGFTIDNKNSLQP